MLAPSNISQLLDGTGSWNQKKKKKMKKNPGKKKK